MQYSIFIKWCLLYWFCGYIRVLVISVCFSPNCRQCIIHLLIWLALVTDKNLQLMFPDISLLLLNHVLEASNLFDWVLMVFHWLPSSFESSSSFLHHLILLTNKWALFPLRAFYSSGLILFLGRILSILISFYKLKQIELHSCFFLHCKCKVNHLLSMWRW